MFFALKTAGREIFLIARMTWFDVASALNFALKVQALLMSSIFSVVISALIREERLPDLC